MVPDVFKQRYGQSQDVADTKVPATTIHRYMPAIFWENDKEIAYYSAGSPLQIIDKEAYKAMVQFLISEVRRIDAEQKAQEKEREEALKGKL